MKLVKVLVFIICLTGLVTAQHNKRASIKSCEIRSLNTVTDIVTIICLREDNTKTIHDVPVVEYVKIFPPVFADQFVKGTAAKTTHEREAHRFAMFASFCDKDSNPDTIENCTILDKKQ